jgi:hypothetical protein
LTPAGVHRRLPRGDIERKAVEVRKPEDLKRSIDESHLIEAAPDPDIG